MTAALHSYRTWFWTLAFLGATLDVATKYALFAWLAPLEERPIVRGFFSLYHPDGLNHGALFGFGKEHGGTANLVFAAFSAVAVAVIIGWYLKNGPKADRTITSALGLILGGALGNLHDRLFIGGVRDFIWWYYEKADGSRLSWPIFNVADSCLVCGAALLLLHAFFTEQAATSNPQPQPEAQQVT